MSMEGEAGARDPPLPAPLIPALPFPPSRNSLAPEDPLPSKVGAAWGVPLHPVLPRANSGPAAPGQGKGSVCDEQQLLDPKMGEKGGFGVPQAGAVPTFSLLPVPAGTRSRPGQESTEEITGIPSEPGPVRIGMWSPDPYGAGRDPGVPLARGWGGSVPTVWSSRDPRE